MKPHTLASPNGSFLLGVSPSPSSPYLSRALSRRENLIYGKSRGEKRNRKIQRRTERRHVISAEHHFTFTSPSPRARERRRVSAPASRVRTAGRGGSGGSQRGARSSAAASGRAERLPRLTSPYGRAGPHAPTVGREGHRPPLSTRPVTAAPPAPSLAHLRCVRRVEEPQLAECFVRRRAGVVGQR